jgi:hypothetical protein
MIELLALLLIFVGIPLTCYIVISDLNDRLF